MSTSMIFDTVVEKIVVCVLGLVAALMILISIILLWALCMKIRSSQSHKDGESLLICHQLICNLVTTL